MRSLLRHGLATVCALAAFAALPASAAYPDQPVKLIVPIGAGSATDTYARVLAEYLARELKGTFVVENRPGASGTIAGAYVARAKPDGYTIGVFNASVITLAPTIVPNVPYDPLKDFTWLGNTFSNPLVLGVGAKSRFRTLDDLIAAARAKSSHVTTGIVGIGTHSHINIELLNQKAGVNLTEVPYSAGTAPVVAGLIGGEIDSASLVWAGFSEQVRAGKIRVLATTAPLKGFPDIPTFAQKGYPDVNLQVGFFLGTPAGLPKEVSDILVPAIANAVKDPKIVSIMESNGFVESYETPEQLTKHVQAEFTELRDIVKSKHITAE